MKKFPKPWFRPSRGVWYVTLDGQQHNLGPDEQKAFKRYKLLLNRTPLPEAKKDFAPSSTVVGLIQRFMADVRANAADDTIEWYRHRLQLFCDWLSEEDLHDVQVNELKKHHIKEWVNGYPHLSSGSKRNLCRSIQRVMAWALEEEIIDVNPLAGLKKPKGGKREIVIQDHEWEDILSFVKNPDLRDLLLVTWETGCRPQESLIVEARHVDQRNQRWHFPIEESKTEIPRVVYLTEAALEITQRRMAQFPQGPIFRNSNGKPWTTDAVNCAFIQIQTRLGERKMEPQKVTRKRLPKEKAARQAHEQQTIERRKERKAAARKLGEKFCLYNIRHTWMNRLLTSGVDSLTVAILAGHTDPSTLAKTYQHLSHNPKFLLEQARRGA